MDRFVDDTRTVWEEVTGLPVNLVDSARATVTSLIEAMVIAAIAIPLLLLVVWRKPLQMLLVMGPLLLAAALTFVATWVLGIPFNFGNIIVLPLLLGVGVDSSVHLVQRSSHAGGGAHELLGSTTAQGVFYSAITTIASFGSLALAGHGGIASLGRLLVVGMLLSLICTLVVLPALLTLTQRRTAD
jgi:predicted RND superfamily exporter protein